MNKTPKNEGQNALNSRSPLVVAQISVPSWLRSTQQHQCHYSRPPTSSRESVYHRFYLPSLMKGTVTLDTLAVIPLFDYFTACSILSTQTSTKSFQDVSGDISLSMTRVANPRNIPTKSVSASNTRCLPSSLSSGQ